MIRAKNYKTVSKFVKVMPRMLWLLFSQTQCVCIILLWNFIFYLLPCFYVSLKCPVLWKLHPVVLTFQWKFQDLTWNQMYWKHSTCHGKYLVEKHILLLQIITTCSLFNVNPLLLWRKYWKRIGQNVSVLMLLLGGTIWQPQKIKRQHDVMGWPHSGYCHAFYLLQLWLS